MEATLRHFLQTFSVRYHDTLPRTDSLMMDKDPFQSTVIREFGFSCLT